jgi:hypothetical protein
MENATLFDQMLKECQEDEGEGVQFANAVKAKGESFTAESLFIALILLQRQRMINKLIQKLSNMKDPIIQKEDKGISLGMCIRCGFFSDVLYRTTSNTFGINCQSVCYNIRSDGKQSRSLYTQ